jgi:hypothetical protein
MFWLLAFNVVVAFKPYLELHVGWFPAGQLKILQIVARKSEEAFQKATNSVFLLDLMKLWLYINEYLQTIYTA